MKKTLLGLICLIFGANSFAETQKSRPDFATLKNQAPVEYNDEDKLRYGPNAMIPFKKEKYYDHLVSLMYRVSRDFFLRSIEVSV